MEEDEEVAEEQAIMNGDPPPRKKRPSESRVPKERGNTKFLTQFANIQESAQKIYDGA